MKKTLGTFALFTAVSLFAVTGCKSKTKDEAPTATTDDTPADPANPCGDKPAEPTGDTPTDPAGDTPPADDVAAADAVPTEEDFEETATMEITSANLESELAKLEKELE